jgi:dihydrodipicolinate synthase/N-acetylneuraminate lyase
MKAEIVVPALALRDEGGRLDAAATAHYARRTAETWVDRFLLSGTTTRGDRMTPDERAAVLDLWLDVAPATRLLAGCWTPSDIDAANDRSVPPIVVMRDLAGTAAALCFLQSLPAGAYVYSHPSHSPVTLDAELCAKAREAGYLPAGAKLAKVGPEDLRSVRSAAGGSFALWDASSRDVAASVAAGASGVVATPLSPFVYPLPPQGTRGVQALLDRVQRQLDALGSREARSAHLHALAASK